YSFKKFNSREGKTAEKAGRHKIKTRNTNPRSRSPECRSRCRNQRSRSPEYAQAIGEQAGISFMQRVIAVIELGSLGHANRFFLY
ncbi:hypothetical protein, partial [Polaromonas sp. DSR2-3-2]|uniref:hypothetical protein n=1 Tax=Polaromonas sp. DSR2-3-2 TaxID=2804622 RepID=UPI003CE96D36